MTRIYHLEEAIYLVFVRTKFSILPNKILKFRSARGPSNACFAHFLPSPTIQKPCLPMQTELFRDDEGREPDDLKRPMAQHQPQAIQSFKHPSGMIFTPSGRVYAILPPVSTIIKSGSRMGICFSFLLCSLISRFSSTK